jgi:hypothetical protein
MMLRRVTKSGFGRIAGTGADLRGSPQSSLPLFCATSAQIPQAAGSAASVHHEMMSQHRS